MCKICEFKKLFESGKSTKPSKSTKSKPTASTGKKKK